MSLQSAVVAEHTARTATEERVVTPARSLDEVLECVQVTDEDILLVARATRRVLTLAGIKVHCVQVCNGFVDICDGTRRKQRLVHDARGFVHAFDTLQPVEPIKVRFSRHA